MCIRDRIQAIRLEHKPFGAKDLRLNPRPQQLFGRHAVVGKETTGGERRSAQDAHPAYLLGPDDGPQAKIKAHRRAKRQQRADELPGVEPEKDVLMVVADFFGDFDLDTTSPLLPIEKGQPFLAAPVVYSVSSSGSSGWNERPSKMRIVSRRPYRTRTTCTVACVPM